MRIRETYSREAVEAFTEKLLKSGWEKYSLGTGSELENFALRWIGSPHCNKDFLFEEVPLETGAVYEMKTMKRFPISLWNRIEKVK